jgi:hypothetical protein
MPDAPQPGGSDLFSNLAARFGVPVALQLLALINPEASTGAKAVSGVNLAGTGAQAAGAASGSPTLAGVGQGIGTAAGLAGAGYGAYQAATNPNFSRQQQVGHSGRAVADAIMSLLIPYYGLARGANVVGQQLERSGSPQVRGAGRAIDQATEPSGAKAFWNVAQGDMSPRKAIEKAGFQGAMYDTMGPVGAILKGVGFKLPFLSHEPTTGTKFRGELGQLFGRVPALKGIDTSKYQMPTGGYGQYGGAFDQAKQLGTLLASRTADSAKNPAAYSLQAANILLNKYGAALPPELTSMLSGARP